MRRSSRSATILLLAMLAPGVAPAQRLPRPFPTVQYDKGVSQDQMPAAARLPPAGVPVAGAVLGGVAGLLGGALLGYGLERAREGSGCVDYCGWGGALLGGVVGEGVGMAVGAHVGDGGRGSLAADLGVSVGSALLAAGLLAVTAGGCHGCVEVPVIIGLAPIVQIVGVVLTERATARSLER